MAGSAEHADLKRDLAITPKTATLLLNCGYRSYRDLATRTPNQVTAEFAALPGMDAKSAYCFKRGLRRMVWLGTQDDPEQQAKDWQDWTQKSLVAKGLWVENYDDLTGEQVEAKWKMTRAGMKKDEPYGVKKSKGR